ncbi:hypothetical protein PTKIN_Ptkin13bG0113500 [Pterospermum kingtungense]
MGDSVFVGMILYSHILKDLTPCTWGKIYPKKDMCEEEDEENCPIIHLPKKEKVRLGRPWRQTLIVKLMGCSVGYNYPLHRIKALWHPKSQVELIAIDNDYFLVKFASMEDYNHGKENCPSILVEEIKDAEVEMAEQKVNQATVGGGDNRQNKEVEVNTEDMDSFGSIPNLFARVKNSKFAALKLLDNPDMGLDDNRPVLFDFNMEPEEVKIQPIACLGGRGRWPNVQISVKEVENNMPIVMANNFGAVDSEIAASTFRRERLVSHSKQAAKETEHVVVWGSQSGKSIVRTVVHRVPDSNTMENTSIFLGRIGLEPHEDPPNIVLYPELDLELMENDGDNMERGLDNVPVVILQKKKG